MSERDDWRHDGGVNEEEEQEERKKLKQPFSPVRQRAWPGCTQGWHYRPVVRVFCLFIYRTEKIFFCSLCGDYFLFGKVYNRYVWCTLALMIVSAICGSVTDLGFSARGYSWQLINCAMTASYSLSLRLLMERHASCARGGKKTLNEMSMVLYNNLLSIPLLVPLALSRGELADEAFHGVSDNPRFVLAASLSVLCAFAISFSSLWFLSTTSATTYSLVGSINKLPLACVAVVLSGNPVTLDNGLSISIGLVASIMFVWAKQMN